jgi:hypothetical protein
MADNISEADARLALKTIEDREREVIEQIGIPAWYWCGLAAGWVALGVASDFGNAWVTGGATLGFGAVHAAAAQRVLSGRRRTSSLTIRADVVDRHLPAVLLACIVALGVITVVLGFLADADGARHASTFASVAPAVAILCGGPGLVAHLARRAARSA